MHVSRGEDDRAFRLPWDDRNSASHARGPPDSGYGAVSGGDDDRWVPRGGPPHGAPPPPHRMQYARGAPAAPRSGSQDRFGASADFPPFADDATLFPPPPMPMHQPPPPPRREAHGGAYEPGSGSSSGVVDPEREAFLAELDRVAKEKDEVWCAEYPSQLFGCSRSSAVQEEPSARQVRVLTTMLVSYPLSQAGRATRAGAKAQAGAAATRGARCGGAASGRPSTGACSCCRGAVPCTAHTGAGGGSKPERGRCGIRCSGIHCLPSLGMALYLDARIEN